MLSLSISSASADTTVLQFCPSVLRPVVATAKPRASGWSTRTAPSGAACETSMPPGAFWLCVDEQLPPNGT
jgi:hypothetical protein